MYVLADNFSIYVVQDNFVRWHKELKYNCTLEPDLHWWYQQREGQRQINLETCDFVALMTITKQNRHIDRQLESIRNSYDVFDERLHNLPQQNLFQMRNILSSFRRSLVCVKMQIKSKSLPNKIQHIFRGRDISWFR